MTRKVCFAFISILLQPHGAAVQAYTGLVVLLVFFVLHVKCRPHESAKTDNVEFLALATEILTMILGLYLFDMPVKASHAWTIVCSFVIVAANSAFIAFASHPLRSLTASARSEL